MKIATITALEARTRFGTLLKRVGRGEEIIVTRHKRPVARIIPVGGRSLVQVQQAVDALHRLRESITGNSLRDASLSDADVRSAMEEGRR